MNHVHRIAAGTLGIVLLALLPEGVTASGPGESSNRPQPRQGSAVAQGVLFASAPATPPGVIQEPAPATIELVRRHMQAGDTDRALADARRLVATQRWGRDSAAAWMLIGVLEREREHDNLASEAFTRVRVAKGPLESWGTYYEALSDLERGRHAVAARECATYQERWPKGRHADACQRLIARAHAERGLAAPALEATETYDNTHADAPITEQIELALSEWQVAHQPKLAVRRLQKLATEYKSPLTGRVATARLASLREAGMDDAVLPSDTASLQTRAVSLRDSGQKSAAIAAFDELSRRSADVPRLAAWVEAETPVFGWRTHSWAMLETRFQGRFDASPNGADLWQLYRAQSRGGQHELAAATARVGLRDYANTSDWRNEEEAIARTYMLAGAYQDARALLDKRSARGGWTGRRTTFFAAFCSVMAGEYDDAMTRLNDILAKDRSYVTEAHYWRMRTLALQDRGEEAELDRQWLATNAPLSWYDVLASKAELTAAPFTRTGSWPGPSLPELPATPTITSLSDIPVASWAPVKGRPAAKGFTLLSWPYQAALQVTQAPEPTLVVADLTAPPPSYADNAMLSEGRTLQSLHELAQKNGDRWPELLLIEDLARVGLYDLAGPEMAEFHEAWRRAMQSRSAPEREAAKVLDLHQEEWRWLFFATRDHHHTLRYTYGLNEGISDPELASAIFKVSWPLAHDRFVWSHARDNDLDPLLVLGLMRQESRYSPIAQSRVGARGAMQIMPRTGHLMADLAQDEHFTAGDLEDPILSIGYGLSYLGLLMERFDNSFPLAVASYNGGPHNVSSWRQGPSAELPMDAFIEHIPFRETRDYVKQVTSNYATYVALYAPPATHVAIPQHLAGDHAEVVDF